MPEMSDYVSAGRLRGRVAVVSGGDSGIGWAVAIGYAMFFLTKAALPHLTPGAAIVNTASVTAYRGSPSLLDYSATKGAIIAFIRSLSLGVADKGIRVNAVAPAFIFLASDDASYMSGQVLHLNGGEVINC